MAAIEKLFALRHARPMRRQLLGLSLVFLLSFLCACGGSDAPEAQPSAPAEPQRAWSAPVTVGTVAGTVTIQELKAGTQGGTTFFWKSSLAQATGGWYHRPHAGSWTASPPLPQQLREGMTFVNAWLAGPDGPRAVLVLDGYQPDDGDGTGAPAPEWQAKFLAFERTGTGWGPPRRLDGIRAAVRCHLAENSAGTALCVLLELRMDTVVPWSMLHDPVSGWQAMQPMDPGTLAAQHVFASSALVVASDGQAMAVWGSTQHSTPQQPPTGFHFYRPGLGWSAVGEVPGAGWFDVRGSLGGGAGSFVLAHLVCDAGNRPASCFPAASRYDPAAGWGRPLQLADRHAPSYASPASSGPAQRPQVRMAADGSAVVFWAIRGTWWSRGLLADGSLAAQAPAPVPFDPSLPVNAVQLQASGRVLAATAAGIYRFIPGIGWQQAAAPAWPAAASPSFVADSTGRVTAVWAEQRVLPIPGASTTSFFSAQYE
jgi:hypothetical protein